MNLINLIGVHILLHSDDNLNEGFCSSSLSCGLGVISEVRASSIVLLSSTKLIEMHINPKTDWFYDSFC